jgi:hypothetical protein
MISPVETVYKGCRFRSRLEARWAVFINSLNFSFVYEPDTYNLSGTWYLPDFWVPDWKSFVEIKSDVPTKVQKDKCQSLSTLTGFQVLLIFGQPWIDEYSVILFYPESSSSSEYEGREDEHFEQACISYEFAQDRKDERVIWLYSDEYGGTSFYVPPDPHPSWGEKYPLTGEWADTLVKAFEAARQERFGT